MSSLRNSFFILVAWLLPSLVTATGNEIAFFYGENPPANVLSQFGRIVVEAENVSAEDLKALRKQGSAAFAYLSVGETGPHRPWYNQLPASASVGSNDSWNSKVMDLTSTHWQRFVLQRVDNLVSRGYQGLFLDTMDSYQLFAQTDQKKLEQQHALSNLLYRMKRRYPELRLISNRGFEVIDQIAPYLEAVAAESLYAGWNNESQSYVEVSQNDRQWLTGKLKNIQTQHKLDIIAIDYVAPADRSKARDVAARINSDGFIPWVANPALDYVGVGTLEAIPREVLMLYNSSQTDNVQEAEVHSLLAMPIEYMGYVPVYLDIAKKPLPVGVLKGKYAGIAMWNRTDVEAPGYREWLLRQLNDKLPIAFFGSTGVSSDKEILDLLGLATASNLHIDSLTLKSKDAMADIEISIPPRPGNLSMRIHSEQAANTSHITFSDKYGTTADTLVTGPWGGLAITPTIIELDLNDKPEWIINPFAFLRKALQLTNAPMPDITTENGKRLWLAHIDGDALPSWAELPGRRLGAEVLYDEIYTKYSFLPHTVSIVEAEMTALDAFFDRRDRMVDVIRKTFELDNVELASHTFSHPFFWNSMSPDEPAGKYNLAVPNYQYNAERELLGSLDYINRTLAPPHKKANIILWTGDAFPTAEALEIVHRHGLLNMNGGNTKISQHSPTVASISPNSRIVDGWLQVYAPIINENVYTNDWTGPYSGYRDVLQTFTMTERPRRIKPINLYYHNYIGTKAASLRSLEEVYRWSVKQEIFPIFASEYIVKVPDFRSAGVARYLDGRWKVSGLGNIRSLRILNKNVWPDLSSTRTLVGATQSHDGNYLHTNGANTVSFHTTRSKPKTPHLVASNAKVERWRPTAGGRISFRLSGHSPVTLELSGDKRFCNVRQQDNIISGELTKQGNTRYNFTTKDTGNAVIDCQT